MPVKVPGVQVSVWPICGVPEIRGSEVARGATGGTVTAALLASALPPAFVPVTWQARSWVTSAAATT
jgi:hypothetical protein